MNLRQRVANIIDPPRQRENPVGSALVQPGLGTASQGGYTYSPATYGEYMAKSISIYSAIQLRANALARPSVIVSRQVMRDGKLTKEPVGPNHPAQQLLDKVNPFWTRGALWRATETYLGLWGKSYWAIFSEGGNPSELWPLRPDRVKPIRDPQEYIRGYIFTGPTGKLIPFLPEEIVRIVYFNPLDEYEGLSPIAPLRLSADLGFDALRANRSALVNDASTGIFLETKENPTSEQVDEFYEHWEKRFKGPDKRNRPAILGGDMKATRMGFNPQELQHLETLRWTVADVARAYGVPVGLLHELSRSTYANLLTMRKMFWEDTIVPQTVFYEEAIQEHLLPRFPEDLVADFDLSAIEALQEDEAAKATRRTQYVNSGIMSVNEVRFEMGLPADPTPEADQLKLGAPVPAFSATPRALPAGRRQLNGMPWEEVGRQLERAFLLELKPRENSLGADLRALFAKQLNAMLAKLREGRSIAPSHEQAFIERLYLTTREEPDDTAILGGLQLFAPDEWQLDLVEMARPHMESAMAASAQAAADQFELGISFDVNRPINQRWLTDRAEWWAGHVNETTGKKVTIAVAKANEEGWSLKQLADELAPIGDGGLQTQARAARSARTEMVSAQNEGHLQAYAQAEVGWKQWLASIDGRERPTHGIAHLQVRPLEADFEVGGALLRAPGQGGVPEETINCRCVALPRFEAAE